MCIEHLRGEDKYSLVRVNPVPKISISKSPLKRATLVETPDIIRLARPSLLVLTRFSQVANFQTGIARKPHTDAHKSVVVERLPAGRNEFRILIQISCDTHTEKQFWGEDRDRPHSVVVEKLPASRIVGNVGVQV